jgi:cytochrome oxidase Cu insertion factor (SCO1/SenC/PrrC family)
VEQNKQTSKGRWKLLLVLAVCAAPMIFSYFTYYVIKPEGRTNYGALIDPREHPMPDVGATLLDGTATALDRYKGKWILLNVDGGACNDVCRRQLLEMRQLRLMQGKEMERIERVWLINDAQPVDTMLMREYEGTSMLRAKADVLKTWLPTEPGTALEEHLYLIDPLGHLMMRFPKNPDPAKVKKDISKLLRASAIG